MPVGYCAMPDRIVFNRRMGIHAHAEPYAYTKPCIHTKNTRVRHQHQRKKPHHGIAG